MVTEDSLVADQQSDHYPLIITLDGPPVNVTPRYEPKSLKPLEVNTKCPDEVKLFQKVVSELENY